MSTLTARLDRLEAKSGGPLRCWVSFDDGPYKSFNEATGKTDELTEAELDALPGDNKRFTWSMQAWRMTRRKANR